jgi:hypothetical protein
VKLERLVKQLQRDAKANPKKAALLGLMVLVALYFWAPLVWQWIGPAEGGQRPSAPVALILTDDPAEPGQRLARSQTAFRWDKVQQRISSDPLMASAVWDAAWTDPFASRTAAAGTAAATAEAPGADGRSAEEAGLILTSVLIGGQRRTATINGRTYTEGELVGGGAGARPMSTPFRITRVEHGMVEMERDGATYRLEMRPAQLAAGDQIGPVRGD